MRKEAISMWREAIVNEAEEAIVEEASKSIKDELKKESNVKAVDVKEGSEETNVKLGSEVTIGKFKPKGIGTARAIGQSPESPKSV